MTIAILILTFIGALVGTGFAGKYVLEAFKDSYEYKSFTFFLFGIGFSVFFFIFLFLDANVLIGILNQL